MNKIRNTLKIAVAAIGVASLSLVANAYEPTSGFTVSPMLGKFSPDKERDLDSYGEFGFIGLGYEWNSKWGLELNYTEGDSEIANSVINADLKALKLDGMYYVGEENLQPYVVFGFGYGKYDLDVFEDTDTESLADFGIGLRYLVGDNVAIRSDIRVLQGLESGFSDYLAGIGATFKFGKASSPRVATPVPTPVPSGPADSDGDGVYDSSDRCPNSPAGSEVNSVGCPLDSDGDGVPNVNDKCPESEAGAKVDAVGCYLVLEEDVSVALQVLFATNSATVNNVNYDEIKEVADFLVQYPITSVVIEGHTDSLGAAAYNKNLSQRRAESVAQILIDRFNVDASRVKAVGYGEERPIVGNDTAEDRAKNRRVQAVVTAVVEKIVK